MGLRQRGFTLVELLTVMVLMAILMSLAFSSVGASLPKWRVQGAANELVSTFQKARAVAVKKNKWAILHFTGVNTPATCATGVYADENNNMLVDAGDTKYHFIAFAKRFPAAYIKSVSDSTATPVNVTSVILQPDGTIRGSNVSMPIKIVVASTSTTYTMSVWVERSGIARIK